MFATRTVHLANEIKEGRQNQEEVEEKKKKKKSKRRRRRSEGAEEDEEEKRKERRRRRRREKKEETKASRRPMACDLQNARFFFILFHSFPPCLSRLPRLFFSLSLSFSLFFLIFFSLSLSPSISVESRRVHALHLPSCSSFFFRTDFVHPTFSPPPKSSPPFILVSPRFTCVYPAILLSNLSPFLLSLPHSSGRGGGAA